MKNTILSHQYFFLDYDVFSIPSFDPCVDLPPPHKLL